MTFGFLFTSSLAAIFSMTLVELKKKKEEKIDRTSGKMKGKPTS